MRYKNQLKTKCTEDSTLVAEESGWPSVNTIISAGSVQHGKRPYMRFHKTLKVKLKVNQTIN